FGFSAAKTAALSMAGLTEPERLLALELASGALDGARGPIRSAGSRIRRLTGEPPLARAA
ncbi:MAG: hypothetical protein J2P47_13820, partial [Acetobacteraceae bacterium]|nr:hypothetical protein [Acetobacteraceae bacterium]